MSEDKSLFCTFQGILIFPKIKNKVNAKGESYENFQASVVLNESNSTKVKDAIKKIKKDHPKINDTCNNIERKIRDYNEKEHLEDKECYLEKFKKGYTHIKGVSSNVKYITFLDFYGKELKHDNFSSGDEVAVVCNVKHTLHEGSHNATFYVNKLVKIREAAFKFSDMSEEARQADDELSAILNAAKTDSIENDDIETPSWDANK